ncbi:MAG: YggT family protein [Chloroflexota bacterium]|nr:YggT family protein [Anaerolineae bacterium]HMM26817.1 YggT family protein [Aggregatilineaceae bacterium]
MEIAALLGLIIYLYSFVILARVLMSWVQVDPNSPLARTLIDLTEPVLAPIRNLLPPTAGLDFSPIIAIVLLQVIGRMIEMLFA